MLHQKSLAGRVSIREPTGSFCGLYSALFILWNMMLIADLSIIGARDNGNYTDHYSGNPYCRSMLPRGYTESDSSSPTAQTVNSSSGKSFPYTNRYFFFPNIFFLDTNLASGRLTRDSWVSNLFFVKNPEKSGKSFFWTPGTKMKFNVFLIFSICYMWPVFLI